MTKDPDLGALDVAIIGMAGRFPGADSVPAFWKNLQEGIESISWFDREAMLSFGVNPIELDRPEFVRAAPVLADSDCFDAAFFGYSPREAELMDPQHRVFLECAWQALESAGYAPNQIPGLTGVYAGTSLSSYLLYNVLPALSDPHAEETLQAMIANDKDFLSTRVSYKLNLSGPSIDVQTGCSTSLVAVHLAVQALLSYQCDLALAGGVSIHVPQRRGYVYQKGGLYSPDGHCRAFDASAEGTLFGSGAGVVTLKRLSDALADRDHIHSILRATAINNDGSSKVGFTAPSLHGQSNVIRLAHAYAGVSAESIGYVECHGTGTPLGDPAEVAALTKAFRVSTKKRQFCAIGSVKTNIGHLDAAAGVASLIKASLAVEHGVIPPSLHFVAAHPELALEESPFYVNDKLTKWSSVEGPRRAGVSSFGIGGTNAHVILEQAPEQPSSPSSRSVHILTLSAKSQNSLANLTDKMVSAIEGNPQTELADIAYTTLMSRGQLPYRNAIICGSAEEAAEAIRCRTSGRFFSGYVPQHSRRIVFMFPGGGSQHVHMAEDLYKEDPVFRERLDELLGRAAKYLDSDLRASLFPPENDSEALARMKDPEIGLAALFLIEYALADYWMQWGIMPDACIGHSLGEYVAAAIGGILSFDDALSLVTTRSRLLARLPAGAMLSIPLPVEEVLEMVGEDLSVAAVNGPSQTVVSGAAAAIKSLQVRLLDQDIETRQIQIAVSSHSHLVDPILEEFRYFTAGLKPRPPRIPYVSNVNGTWITNEEAANPEYWVRHLRGTVLFGKGIGEFVADSKTILLEVGPGNALTTLLQTQFRSACVGRVIASLRHPYEKVSDHVSIMGALAQLWTAGVTPRWERAYAGESRRRIPLPTYPFERRHHWLPAGDTAAGARGRRLPYSRWFHRPVWRGGAILHIGASRPERTCQFVVAGEPCRLSHEVREKLSSAGHSVFCVELGAEFEVLADQRFRVDRARAEDYFKLSEHLNERYQTTSTILYFADLSASSTAPSGRRPDPSGHLAEILALVQGLGRKPHARKTEVTIIAVGALQLFDDDLVRLDGSLLSGLARVAGQDFPGMLVRLVDVDPADSIELGWDAMASGIAAHILKPDPERMFAIRARRGWAPAYEQVEIPKSISGVPVPKGSRYVITGGLGSIGLELAAFLARTQAARLVLISRSRLPDRDAWERILGSEPEESTRSRRIRAIREIEAMGSEVLLLSADVSDEDDLETAFRNAEERFGSIDGVFHLAGTTGADAIQLIGDATVDDLARQIGAKTDGVLSIEKICQSRKPDFVFLFSSSASYLGGIGLMAYAGSNVFLNSIARKNETVGRTRWISANWDAWLPADLSDETTLPKDIREFAITAEQGCRAVVDIVESGLSGQIIVSRENPEARVRRSTLAISEPVRESTDEQPIHRDLDTLYVPPSNETEIAVTRLWEELLGLKQVSVHENFFELGGSSLIALRLISRIKREWKIDVPIVSIFEKPTVATFSELLAQIGPASRVPTDARNAEFRSGERTEGLVSAR